MNIALIFHGIIHRSLKYTYKSFEENILHPLNQFGVVDIFYHSWDCSKILNPRGLEFNHPIDINDAYKFLPNAIGVFENQDLFDSTINWRTKINGYPKVSNPTDIEQLLICLIKNCVRDAASIQGAWYFTQSKKTKHYDMYVIARPDVKFINKLKFDISNFELNTVYVPKFHSWEGINDRFAIGDERAIGKYCCKFNETMEWVGNGIIDNSEKFLKNYLISKNVNINYIDIIFQRIRANGNIFSLDEDLQEIIIE